MIDPLNFSEPSKFKFINFSCNSAKNMLFSFYVVENKISNFFRLKIISNCLLQWIWLFWHCRSYLAHNNNNNQSTDNCVYCWIFYNVMKSEKNCWPSLHVFNYFTCHVDWTAFTTTFRGAIDYSGYQSIYKYLSIFVYAFCTFYFLESVVCLRVRKPTSRHLRLAFTITSNVYGCLQQWKITIRKV